MKSTMHSRKRVFLFAVTILAVCAGLFIVSTQIALGTQKKAAVSQQSTYSEAEAQASTDTVTVNDTGEESEASAAAASPSPPVFITEEDAINAFMWVAENIFEISVDENTLTATFEDVRTDENASNYTSVHSTWHIQNSNLEWDSDYYCLIDAVTGNVLIFDDQTHTYSGKSISKGDFNSEYAQNIYNDPDNIYTTAARDFVESMLSNGRKITDIELDGIQFIWDDPDCLNPDDADTPGTIQVDCWVIMESGQNYNLSFWGTDQVVLKFFSTYPTMYACQWGYFYEKNAPNSSEEWTTAPGITEGTSSDQGGK